jgi:peptide/nickel transport system permease protein
MRNYILKRLLVAIPTILGISIVIFLIMRLIPGDTISAMIGTQYKLTEAQAQSLRAYYGLDKSLPEQYLSWLLNAVQGNLGLSVRAGTPVLNEILGRFPLTFELTILAMVIALIIGLPIGIFSAVKRDSILDLFGRLLALIGMSLPNFWMGTLIIFVLSVYFGILPNSGNYVDFSVNPLENLKQMIYPAITLGFAFSAAVMRTTRSSLLEELNKEYAQTARAKGSRELQVILKHCLRNTLIPLITLVGFQMGYLFGGAVIVEEVFAMPGMGQLLLNAISQRDYALAQGTIVFIAIIFVLVNLFTDITYAFVNPRIRYE